MHFPSLPDYAPEPSHAARAGWPFLCGAHGLGDESTPRFRPRLGAGRKKDKTNARSIYLQVTPWGMLNSAMPSRSELPPGGGYRGSELLLLNSPHESSGH